MAELQKAFSIKTNTSTHFTLEWNLYIGQSDAVTHNSLAVAFYFYSLVEKLCESWNALSFRDFLLLPKLC